MKVADACRADREWCAEVRIGTRLRRVRMVRGGEFLEPCYDAIDDEATQNALELSGLWWPINELSAVDQLARVDVEPPEWPDAVCADCGEWAATPVYWGKTDAVCGHCHQARLLADEVVT